MNSNKLKLIAVIAMLIDHLADIIGASNPLIKQLMHGVGRITFPIMAFFISEGFNKTSNIKRYILRLGIFTLISHTPYRFYTFSMEGLNGLSTSVMFTFLISLLVLSAYESKKLRISIKVTLITLLFIVSMVGDYIIFGPMLVLAFHKGYGNINKQLRNGLIVILGLITFSLVITEFRTLYTFATILPLMLLKTYNGEKGHSNKLINYAFYIIYPLQFVVIGMLK